MLKITITIISAAESFEKVEKSPKNSKKCPKTGFKKGTRFTTPISLCQSYVLTLGLLQKFKRNLSKTRRLEDIGTFFFQQPISKKTKTKIQKSKQSIEH